MFENLYHKKIYRCPLSSSFSTLDLLYTWEDLVSSKLSLLKPSSILNEFEIYPAEALDTEAYVYSDPIRLGLISSEKSLCSSLQAPLVRKLQSEHQSWTSSE